MSLVLGVDGGNTKTIALVASTDGTIVGSGRAGCGDIYTGMQEALLQVRHAVDTALFTAGTEREDILSAVFSMAGADWPEDFAELTAAFAAWLPCSRIDVVNDAIGALRAGSHDGTGVSVVCGTGAATGARNSSGSTWHTSFWQGPQGSRDLATQALRAVYEAELGLAPPTRLTAHVLRLTGHSTVEAVLHDMTHRSGNRGQDIIGLTRLLLNEARFGDERATEIVCRHGVALGRYAVVAASRTDQADPFTLVLAGSVFRELCEPLVASLVSTVRLNYPHVDPILNCLEPAAGALLLALDALRVTTSDTWERLRETHPPSSLFVTI